MHPYFQAIVAAYAAAGRPFYHQVTPAAAREMMRTAMRAAPKPADLPVLAAVTDEKFQGRTVASRPPLSAGWRCGGHLCLLPRRRLGDRRSRYRR